MDIVGLKRVGLPAEEMQTHFSSRPLTLAEIHAALAYYYDNKSEIDGCFEDDQRWDEGHEERRAEYLKQRTRG